VCYAPPDGSAARLARQFATHAWEINSAVREQVLATNAIQEDMAILMVIASFALRESSVVQVQDLALLAQQDDGAAL
jgi:hypothetical protein